MEKASGRNIIGKTSWRKHHRVGIMMEDASGRRHRCRISEESIIEEETSIMEKASWGVHRGEGIKSRRTDAS